jgi:hypothetical protein
VTARRYGRGLRPRARRKDSRARRVRRSLPRLARPVRPEDRILLVADRRKGAARPADRKEALRSALHRDDLGPSGARSIHRPFSCAPSLGRGSARTSSTSPIPGSSACWARRTPTRACPGKPGCGGSPTPPAPSRSWKNASVRNLVSCGSGIGSSMCRNAAAASPSHPKAPFSPAALSSRQPHLARLKTSRRGVTKLARAAHTLRRRRVPPRGA